MPSSTTPRRGAYVLLAAVAAAAAAAAIPARRRVFPERAPEVCLVLISSDAHPLDTLAKVYSGAITYLEGQQSGGGGGARPPPPLRYEVVWADSGSSAGRRKRFRRLVKPQLEAEVLSPTNRGLYAAINAAWFDAGGCTARYILSLEDDWLPRAGVLWQPTHLRRSMKLLQHDSAVAGVRLKNDWTDEVVPTSGGWRGDGSTTTHYQHQCTDISNGMVWGSFTTAAVLYDRERLLRRVGRIYGAGGSHDPMPWEYGEGNYAVRCSLPRHMGGGGLCTAMPHLCDTCSGNDGLSPSLVAAAADAAAASQSPPRNPAAPCHNVFYELRPKTARDLADYRWFLWGTPLHPDNRTHEL
jgi:hypothetical protein